MKNKISFLVLFSSIIIISCGGFVNQNSIELESQEVFQNHAETKTVSKDTIGLAIFLEQLKKIVSDKDSLALDNIIYESIAVDFSGAIYGKQAFYEYWYAEDQPKDTLWNNLSKLISYGGNYSNQFLAYRFPFFASDDIFDCPIECMFYAANIVENPILYDHKNTKVKKDLPLYNCLILNHDENMLKEGFERILLPNDTVPYYISEKDIYRCSALNLIIEKNEKGKWYITSFSAGA
jgi:hypothetical protein